MFFFVQGDPVIALGGMFPAAHTGIVCFPMITSGGLLQSCVGSPWLCVAVFSHTMEEADIILGELLRIGGLSLEQKQALITQARLSMSDQVQIFPDNPHLYMERLQALLVRALFPHSGLLSIRKEAVGGVKWVV